MANTADLPEILFQRISPAYAGENVAQLSKQRYRPLFRYCHVRRTQRSAGARNRALDSFAGYMMLVMFSPSYYTDFNTTVDAEEPAAHREATDALVINFRQLVEKHFREHWSMEDYSHQLGVTPRRLLSACKHATGKFPKALVHERIMREARADLVYSNKSISEIAYALGFESAAYFSRFYKRYAGVSPSDNPRPKATGDGPRAH